VVQDAIEEHVEDSNPARAFITSTYRAATEEEKGKVEVLAKQAYLNYEAHVTTSGLKYPITAKEFAKEMGRCFPHLQEMKEEIKKQQRKANQRPNCGLASKKLKGIGSTGWAYPDITNIDSQ
jgi:hypothetical protein